MPSVDVVVPVYNEERALPRSIPVLRDFLASDAFFPFARDDAVELACRAGVTAIIQPGGAVRDEEAVEVCDEYGVAMVFTGVRHFKH